MLYMLCGILILYCFVFIYKTKTGSPSVWSKDAHIVHLMRYVKPGMRIADFGCGDARVLTAAVEHGAELAEGFEIEPYVYYLARKRIARHPSHAKIKVYFRDMWTAQLSRYDLVFVYQLTRYAPRFREKCLREMRPGSLVIANTYPIPGLRLLKRDGVLFVYQV